jgi:ribosome maturation factor RimP
MDPRELQRSVRELLEPSIHHLGFELVAVEWAAGDQGKVLRLSIDHSKGITAQNCADVTHMVSPVLDDADPISQRYALEVSSPGMQRPVQLPADFERFAGYRAKVRLVAGHPRRRFTGTIAGFSDDEVAILVDGVEHKLHLDDIERAHLDLTLEEYQAMARTEEPDAHQ